MNTDGLIKSPQKKKCIRFWSTHKAKCVFDYNWIAIKQLAFVK